MWAMAPAIWLSFGGYGCWIATIKRRNPAEGLLFGLLLGPIGCVVEASRRERTQRTVEEIEEQRVRSAGEAEARAEREADRLSAWRAEDDRRRQAARLRADEARVRRAEAYVRFSIWFDRAVLKFGWFKVLPEVAQPIIIGLSLGLPVVAVVIYLFRGR